MAESEVLVDPSEEDESDIQGVRRGASLSSSDWTVETILSQMRRGNIQLNPGFQRRDAWTDSRKSRFIESLILGLPVPQLVLAESKEERGKFIVLDGKQRLLSLERFTDSTLQDDDGNPIPPLRLTSLKSIPELNGKTYEDLLTDSHLEHLLRDFDNQTIRTVVVRQWPEETYLYTVFYRLNSETVPLSPQELRQALHPGPFLRFAEQYSAKSHSLQRALGIDRPDFRMRDVEILVRYFGFSEFLPLYRGNLKQFLDETAERLNKAWPKRRAHLEGLAKACDASIDATFAIFDENSFRRFAGQDYERRFNRAVFDIMTFYFRDATISKEAFAKRRKVKAAFERLCVQDDEFQESIQSTTKTITATFKRLRAWGDTLAELTSLPINRPTLEGNQIKV